MKAHPTMLCILLVIVIMYSHNYHARVRVRAVSCDDRDGVESEFVVASGE